MEDDYKKCCIWYTRFYSNLFSLVISIISFTVISTYLEEIKWFHTCTKLIWALTRFFLGIDEYISLQFSELWKYALVTSLEKLKAQYRCKYRQYFSCGLSNRSYVVVKQFFVTSRWSCTTNLAFHKSSSAPSSLMASTNLPFNILPSSGNSLRNTSFQVFHSSKHAPFCFASSNSHALGYFGWTISISIVMKSGEWSDPLFDVGVDKIFCKDGNMV